MAPSCRHAPQTGGDRCHVRLQGIQARRVSIRHRRQFCELDYVIVSKDGGGFRGVTDEALSKVGLTRRVVLSVPHFLFVTSVLANIDLVAMLPSRLVRDTRLLRVVEPPIDVPGFEMAMFWHERTHRDPGHQWLREHLANSV